LDETNETFLILERREREREKREREEREKREREHIS
jgi:hypothetical protein